MGRVGVEPTTFPTAISNTPIPESRPEYGICQAFVDRGFRNSLARESLDLD